MPSRPTIHCAKPKQGEQAYDKQRNTQAHRKAIRSWRWQQFRDWYLSQNPLCSDCGRVATDVHHTRGLADHPDDLCDPEYLLPLCHACHTVRTNRGE